MPSSISISPLTTAHPLALYDQWVRASAACYSSFTLAMASSLGFGSYVHYNHCKQWIRRLRLGFPAPTFHRNLSCSTHKLVGSFFNRNTVTRHKAWLQLFVSKRFQILFHPPHRGAFHLSLTVLVHYRSLNVFSLTA